ncbi:Vps51/Vps67 family (components of vesicular transport) protein [Rhynchospora pubera]|uniref:Conserved oligomeric Golgi complex subunit 1 n=1 Tax=Rhynchospora pubera TaxID=906938 RepID=A0AAV8HLU7_9POAL|nr:Vps51/Vps67 family (components of vesicular transport) protein [Rhynchospora pubera]
MKAPSSTVGGTTVSDAESLFRSKKISEIRSIEAATRQEIDQKTDELRLLVGRSYRDLIDSADSIILIHSSSQSISSTLASISSSLQSLSNPPKSHQTVPKNPNRSRLYSAAARVKYVVDTPEHIWGCLDDSDSSMLLEASGRYLRASQVHSLLLQSSDLDRFPLLKHQWQIVRSFRTQISQRSRDRLSYQGLTLSSYADALAAAAVIDNLNPKEILALFLDSRKGWILQKLSNVSSDPDVDPSAMLCDIARVIKASLGHVGQLFLHALNEMPLFYKTILGSPPGSQYFGGIPNPEQEVRLWKEHMEVLESTMILLDPEFVANTCASWLQDCCGEIFGDISGGVKLINSIVNGDALARNERLVKCVLDGRDDLEESLEHWLKSVFGTEIESPWDQIRGLILKDSKDVLEERMEEALLKRMKNIVHFEFENLGKSVNLTDLIEQIVSDAKDAQNRGFSAYLKRSNVDGGVWFSELKQKRGGILANLKPISDESDFKTCLSSYLGPQVTKIRDDVDNKCKVILEDVLSFIESNNSGPRLKELVPFLQEKCYITISTILKELEDELLKISSLLDTNGILPSVSVERSLFIGRLLFALRYHSSNIPLILGTPRQWVRDSATSSSPLTKQGSPFMLKRYSSFDSPRSPHRSIMENHPRRQTLAAVAAFFGSDFKSNPKLDELNKTLEMLCIKAHGVWINWVSEELSSMLLRDLQRDDALSASTPLRGWEVTMVKQESSDGPLELQLALPSMPSLYVISFLYLACLEIHRVGGHILNRIVLQNFAWELLDKVVKNYENFFDATQSSNSRVSEKGLLQILLDLRFIGDILAGGKNPSSNNSDASPKQDQLSQATVMKSPFRRRQLTLNSDFPAAIPVSKLINKFSTSLDPIDWAMYEPYLWENEKQSYMSYVVLFGFLVQLNRMYTDVVQKSPTKSNANLNIMRCSQVPRFKYLPISAPVLSSRAVHTSSLQAPSDETPRSPYRSFSNGEVSQSSEFDDGVTFGGATPLLRSFMTQVGSRFGESTSRLGSMLSDGQVTRLRERSLSSFGDILPGSAAGLLSSLTSGARFDS